MANIPKQAIKKMIKSYFKLQITDEAAAALAEMLEKRAKKISSLAVKNARSEKRDKVIRKDIEESALKVGLDED